MPRATADKTKTKRFDLETVEGGFIVLRKLDYGQQLHITEISASARSQQNGQARGGGAGMTIDFKATAVQVYTFSNAIVDHNLEDENGRKLNFSNAADIAKLDVPVGNEIEDTIQGFNGNEDHPFSQDSPTETTSTDEA